MARPKKEGLDYFSHDTNASGDLKIEPIIYLYGAKGYAFYFMHLEYIYREPSLSLDISDAETMQILCRKLQITEQEYNSILVSCLKKGLFDEEIYQKERCLTSNGIKKRAAKVVEKREKMAERYEKTVSDIVSTAETTQETQAETRQRKEKERKVNKSKEREEKKEELSLSQKKFLEAFPNRKVDCEISEKIDIDKLIEKINESAFLKSADNMSLKSCVEHADKILAGAYKDFVVPKTIDKNYMHKNYDSKTLNAMFANLDEILEAK